MEVRYRIWLERNGKPFFGDGRCELLGLIGERGSISGAAKELGMSYRKAWGDVQLMEDRLGIRLVETERGGKSGGGARITESARELLDNYARFRKDVDEKVEEAFKAYFC